MTDVVVRLAQWAENDMKAEGIALEAKHAIEELRKDVTAFWNEMELMRSDLSIYAEEIERYQKTLKLIEELPVEESKQWEVAIKEIKRLVRAALQHWDNLK